MSNLYLKDFSSKLDEHNRNYYGDNVDVKAMITLMRLIASIIPKQVTPEELVIYIRFLLKDIENGKCGFLRSKKTANLFEQYQQYSKTISVHLSWLPSELENYVSKEFVTELTPLFAHIFFSAEETIGKEEAQEYGCIEIDEYTVDISNKNRAEVLAALYNNSKPIGMGVVQYDPTLMTVEIAEKLLEQKSCFDYLKGRTMKISFETDILYVYGYNRDNNRDRLAQRVIAELPNIPIARKTKKNNE